MIQEAITESEHASKLASEEAERAAAEEAEGAAFHRVSALSFVLGLKCVCPSHGGSASERMESY